MDIFNSYREQINYRTKIHYYMLKDINKRLKNYEIDNIELNKKIINLNYSLIISYLIIIYLLFIK